MSVSRLLLIGLDGLEPSLVQRWIASGDLPHLARLRNTGRWGPLRSTLPCATFPAWTSILTGVNPGQHGVFDFARLISGSYDVEFAGAAIRRRPSLPMLASNSGLRVACVGFPATYPPEPVNGLMIGGFDSPVAVSIDHSFVHPPELAHTLEARFGRYVFADFAETRSWMPGWHRRAARKLLRGLTRRADIAHHLLARERWDLFMVHFGESDTAAHHFWAFHDPRSPRYPGHAATDDLQMVLQQVYMALDAAVGRLCAQVGDQAHVMVVSDHGFGGAGDKVLYLNRWLAQHGWLSFS
ncbi:MAG: alkaline phosphatase family protein, partial [Myxococcota bacterium]